MNRALLDWEREYPQLFALHGVELAPAPGQGQSGLPWPDILARVEDQRQRDFLSHLAELLDQHPARLLAQDGVVVLDAPLAWQAKERKVYAYLANLVCDLAAPALDEHVLPLLGQRP